MHSEDQSTPRHRRWGVAVLAVLLLAALSAATVARAASAPAIRAVWSTEVSASSVRLRAEVNPGGARITYHFDYITLAAYQANVNAGRDGFTGALKAPAGSDSSVGEGTAYVMVAQSRSALSPATAYRYRLVAANAEGTTTSATYAFTTQALGGASLLADGRSWEMVSPVDKNGGQIQGSGGNYGGDVLQAASSGEAATYTSSASFGTGGGNPGANQYISRRTESGWATENITAPTLSGAYGEAPDGVPFRLFSGDLAWGLMLNGDHCRIETSEACPVANPPLPGSGAPTGYQNYYLRNDATGAYTALVTSAEVARSASDASTFSVSFAGATPDLSHILLSTCAKLTADATEQPACGSGGPNLYEWSAGQLKLVNRLGADTLGTSDAHLAAPVGAVSANGQRVYFTVGEEETLYLREGEAGARQVAELASFQAASVDGQVAFYLKSGQLFRYQAQSGSSETIASGVQGVLGASENGQVVYFQDGGGLERWHEGAVSQVAAGPEAASAADWPPATGTARVSPDGSELLFVSAEPRNGYDNTDQSSPLPCGQSEGALTGVCDAEVYLWSVSEGLRCLSCNPTGERPTGGSGISGAVANGTTRAYKPRVLAASGRRVFFESADALVLSDTNKAADVYEWEAQGEGSCSLPGGCTTLISSGRSAESSFVDTSATGSDVFFLTDGSLVKTDPGSVDLYDARVNGGFPEPPPPIACEGDACQPLPSEPEDPEPGTERQGTGNPPLPQIKRCKKGFIRRHGKCVKHHKHAKRKKRRRHG